MVEKITSKNLYNENSSKKSYQYSGQEFKIQVLVKDGLDLVSRIDAQGIFANRPNKIRQTSPLQRQGTSQEMSVEDATGISTYPKKVPLESVHNSSKLNIDVDRKSPKSQASWGQQNILLTIYGHLDKLQSKDTSQKQRFQSCQKIRQLVQEIMIENQELKQRAERASSGSGKGNNKSQASLENPPQQTAGAIIDNFGTGQLDKEDAVFDQMARFQAKILTLESENQILNEKLTQLIVEKEETNNQLKHANMQLSTILKDVYPKSSFSQQLFKSANRQREEKNNTPLKKVHHSGSININEYEPHKLDLFASKKQFSQIQKTERKQLCGSLQAIESDNEEDDLQIPNHKKTNNTNDDLFEKQDDMAFDESNNIKKCRSELSIDKQQQSKKESQNADVELLDQTSDEDQDQVSLIKQNLDLLQKVNSNGFLNPKYQNVRTKSRFQYLKSNHETKSFKNEESDQQSILSGRSQSSIQIYDRRNNSININVERLDPQQIRGRSKQKNDLKTQQSLASLTRNPIQIDLNSVGQYRSKSKLSKMEPKSHWEPNEQSQDCNQCHAKFSNFRRRHHCRKCGLLYCGKCSQNSSYVPGYQDQRVRMCDKCFKEQMAYKVSAHNVNKTSVFSSYFGNNIQT